MSINLKKNIIMSGSFRIVVLILSFLSSWITARYLGVELKGKLSYFITMGGFIWMVMDFGLFRSYPYIVRKNPDKVDSLFTWTLLCFVAETIIMSLLGLGLLNLWSSLLGFTFSRITILLFVLFITLTKLFMQMQGLYVGLDRIFESSIGYFLNSFVGTALFVLAFFLLRNSDRLLVVMCITIFTAFSCALYLLLKYGQKIRWSELELSFSKVAYSYGFRVFLSSLFIMLLLKVDIVIVKQMLGFAEVGIYSVASHIVDILQVASNMVGSLLLVKLSDTEDDVEKWVLMKKMLMVFFLFLSVANIGFILVGKLILQVMFGEQFVPVYYVYIWLMPACYGLSFGSLFNNYLNAKGFPIISIILPALAVVLNVALNYILIPVWGIYGAAVATSVAYLLWFILIVAYEQKCTKGVMIKHLIPVKQDWMDVYHLMIGFVRRNMNKRNR